MAVILRPVQMRWVRGADDDPADLCAYTLLLVAAVVTIPVAAGVEQPGDTWFPFCLFNGFLFAGGVFTSFALRIFSRWSAIVFALVFAAGCAFGAWLGLREVGRATSSGMRVVFLLAALGLALGALGNLLASARPLRVGRCAG